MKQILHLSLLYTFFTASTLINLQAQDCSILAPGTDAGFDQLGFCAPVTGRVKYFTFYTISPIQKDKLKVEVNWGEKKIRYAVDSLGYDAERQVWIYQLPATTYEYAAGRTNPQCSYPVTVQAVVNNALCSTPKQSGTVMVWDKDDANGGRIVLDPTTYYACPGTDFTVNFTDESRWNCAPPQNGNWPKRTTQFVYGSASTITGNIRIGEEIIGSFPFEGPLQEYADRTSGPGGPFKTSSAITIPATAQPGEQFEVTLNNWNYCNPYPAAPVQKKAIIKIVARPIGQISIQNTTAEEVTAFCPNEEVRLLGSYFTEAGVVNPEDIRYDWEVQDVSTGAVQTYANQQNVTLSSGFPRPGQQRVLLKVSNKKTNTVVCQQVTEQVIELIDAPSVQTFLNDTPGMELNFCAENPERVAIPVTYRHLFNSNEAFTFTYHLYTKNSTAGSPDSTLHFQSGSGLEGVEKSDTFSILYSQPGIYRIQLIARNNRTGCRTIEESRIIIYENPVAAFATEGHCAGQTVRFTNLSRASAVPGDRIIRWEWDMNYSQENEEQNTFDIEKSGEGPVSHTFPEAGSYRVALRVTNAAGCSNLFFDNLEMNELPIAQLSSNYTGGLICPGDTVRFFNQSPALNSPGRFPEGISYTLHISDSIAIRSFPFSEEQEYLDYSSFFNPNDSVETYTVWLEAQANDPNFCKVKSHPVLIKVRSGAAAGYSALPTYSPFEPNCSPKPLRFVTNSSTQALDADRYKWTILLNGEVQKEISKERGDASFDTLEVTLTNHQLRYLDYRVILSAEKEGSCIIPAINTFRIYPNPLARFSALPALEACDSTVFEVRVNLPFGISDYSWEFSRLPVNEAEIGIKDDHFYMAYNRPAYGQEADTIQVKLRARNFYGCTAEWTENIVINPVVMHQPQLALTATEGDGCRPLRASFTNQTIGDSALSSFELFVENLATGSLQKIEETELTGSLSSSFSYTFRQEGNYHVYLKATAQLEGGQCVRPLSSPVAIRVLPDPTPAFTIFPTKDCGSLRATITKTGLSSTFDTWQVSNVESGEILYGPARFAASEDTLSQYLFENHTNQTIRYRIVRWAESSAGCTASDSTEVQVYPMPKAYFEANSSVCDPYVVEVAHQTLDNSADTRYTWLWGDGSSSEGASPPPHTYHNNSYTRPLHYNLRLIAESANGCRADSTIRLVIQPKVKADFEADVLTGCAPLHVNFTNLSRGAAEELSGWYIREEGEASFSFAGHSLLFHEFENHSSKLKTYEVMYKAQNAGGCIDSVLKEIRVRPEILTHFSLSPDEKTYSGHPITFISEQLIPGVSYRWNWGDGSAPQEATTKEVQHTYINSSTSKHYYEVSLTAYDPRSGCESISRKMVTVYPALQLSLHPKKEKVCLPELPEFIPQVKNVVSAYWYVGEKGKVDYSRRLSTIYDADLFPNSSGRPITYSVTYVGVSEQGIKDSVEAEIQVYPALAPSFTLDGLDKSLPHARFTITNTTPNAGAFTSLWSFGNGEESQQAQPGTYEYSQYGLFTITLTISNGFCSATYAMKIQVDDAEPRIAFGMEGTEGCSPLEVRFTNQSTYSDEEKYFWDFGDGIGTSTAIHPVYTYNKPGNYKVTLHAFNRTGTESAQYTSEQLLRVYPMPRADFVVRKEQVYTPDEAVYVANYSERANWYRWDFGDGTIYEGEEYAEPVHYYKKPGVYTIQLLVRSPHGCMDSLTVQRAVTAIGGGEIRTPTAFTPNPSGSNGGRIEGAGKNDVFHPLIKGGVVAYHLQVFNRWGELVFETRDKDTGWDGYYKGSLCPSDVYVFRLSTELSDGKRINKTGDFVLVR